jgi:tryptophanase
MREPYRIKVVEPLARTSRKKRRKILESAGYNPFLIPAECVTIDLVSDSGTGAMTSEQWAAMLGAREDFAGQTTHTEFTDAARSLTGFPFIQPVHQGRSAENILFGLLLKPGDKVVSNTHFETTRGNILALRCHAVDLPSDEQAFLGNIDTRALAATMKRPKAAKLVILTITNNVKGGQPVSMANIAQTKRIAEKHGIPLILDASRFADNAFLIKDHGEVKRSIRTICRQMFGLADIIYLSSKKDGLVNIGGFIGLRDRELYDRLRYEVIRQESFPTSGGLAARDMAAMTHGLRDAVDEQFLRSHIENVRFLGQMLKQNGVRIFEPVGGHAVVILPRKNHRHFAFALAAKIYAGSGIRTGVFDDCVRLALPRRVYTREHLQYASICIARAYLQQLPKMRLTHRPREFFNFFARFAASAQERL